MRAPTAIAPRFAALIAGIVMVYAIGWGSIRVAIAGFPPASIACLVLLCIAFLLVRVRGAAGSVRAFFSGLFALGGVAAALIADGGHVEVADIWLTPAVACIALLLLWRRRHLIAWATMGGQSALLWAAGGFEQLENLGTLTTVLTLGVVAAAGRVLGWYSKQMHQYSQTEQNALEWRVAQNAYQESHQQRIEQTGTLAGAMLRQIVATNGRLEVLDRAECRVLHQTIRDETRGRLLLSDAVRDQVQTHRRRGATVQLLDDGELGRLEATSLARLHDEIASQIEPLISDRIVIRSGIRDGSHIVTIAATTVDPIAVALGLDDDEQVDLWHTIKIPVVTRLATTGMTAEGL